MPLDLNYVLSIVLGSCALCSILLDVVTRLLYKGLDALQKGLVSLIDCRYLGV